MGHWAYNGYDTMVTREVFDTIAPRLDNTTRRTYEFEMATQAPAMAMMRRGVLVDQAARFRALKELEKEFETSQGNVNALIPEGKWTRTQIVTAKVIPCSDGKQHKWPRGVEDTPEKCCEKCGTSRLTHAPLNAMSPDQVSELFYEQFGYRQLYNKKGNVSTDDDTLQKIARQHPEAAKLVDAILETRGINKQHGVMNSAVSADSRMRSSFNVGAPETGRWSSSENAYHEGTNLQNITEKLRYIFIADPGLDLFYADLEQAESKCVAYLAGDQNYIDAHNNGDVHTYAARMIWPKLPWTGDLKKDKIIAEDLHPDWDPEHSYRYNAKRIQHGSNYGLTPFGLAMLAHIPVKAAEEAQAAYFQGFPMIPAWQRATIKELLDTHTITTPLGRRRQFFGRPWDKHVQRQAIAQVPQSMVADILNLALWRVWNELDTSPGLPPDPRQPNGVWLLAQVHDAILGEVRHKDDATIQRVLDLMQIPVLVGGRVMTIGVDCKVGQNWGKYSQDNLGGMR